MIYTKDKKIKQFIDTNIFVYAFDNSAGEKHKIAQNILRENWINKTGCLSTQVIQEFFVTVTKKICNPIKIDIAEKIIDDLMVWDLHTVSPENIKQAILFQKDFCISFWDSLIISSAVSLGSKTIISEDLNNGQEYYGVKVINPFVKM